MISSKLKQEYEDSFVWTLFILLQKWTIENDDDTTWDMLNGYTFNGEHNESLIEHRDILKKIWIAEYVLHKKIVPLQKLTR